MKHPSEAAFGRALRDVDDSVPTYVYRVPDPKGATGVSNWKPCDFMVWTLAALEVDALGSTAWFECKYLKDAVNFLPPAILRPSQRLGVETAKRIGIPYWVAVFWGRHGYWTISDAVKMGLVPDVPVTRDLLQTRYGVAAQPRELVSTLKSILAGEVR